MPSPLSHQNVVNFVGGDISTYQTDFASTVDKTDSVMDGVDKDTYDRNMNYSFALRRCMAL
jgi:hypothetical protein